MAQGTDRASGSTGATGLVVARSGLIEVPLGARSRVDAVSDIREHLEQFAGVFVREDPNTDASAADDEAATVTDAAMGAAFQIERAYSRARSRGREDANGKAEMNW